MARTAAATVFRACGCGEAYAIGAMYATPGMAPRDRVALALRAAEENSAGVRGPFVIESIGPAGERPTALPKIDAGDARV
jgi:hypothetical protein